MKNSYKIALIVVLTLSIGLGLGYLFFGTREAETHETHAGHGEEEATIWTCSMHPQIRQSEPGKCPICGMELIPLESNGGEENPMAVQMSPTAMQLANVETMVVGKEEAVKNLRLTGKVKADERKVYTQTSHFPGRIEKLMVNFTGEYVEKGQVLAYVYSPELVTAQTELFQAYKIRETQPALFRAAKNKLKNWKLTNNQINRILQRGEPQTDFPILADVSGVVLEKYVNTGDHVNAGMPVYEVSDLSEVWVMFDVYESDMAWIEEGAKVEFQVQSIPGKTFTGEVTFLDPVVDPGTRVASARVEVDNPDQRLKPEMFATGIVKSQLGDGAKDAAPADKVVVPKSAVMWTGERSVVYVKTASEKGVSFEMREVTLGPALGDSYVIQEGLEAGEEIATSGTFSIDAAAQLAGKPSMMNPEGGTSMTGHNHGEGASSATKPAVGNVSLSEKAKEAVSSINQGYFAIKEALVNDDLEKTKKAARQLLQVLKTTDMSLFEGDSHQLWMSFSEKATDMTKEIAAANDLSEARKHFKGLSEGVIAFATATGGGENTLYVQFCPMADDNQGGEWLSQTEEILNPYMGQSMLACGELRREIE